ncbi:uncharacterized protein LOC143587439 [Bidens hawaiensis]|uniref:uncharacterized protein LOC143587439 n=1 Tax=Bidens hawaiensis TaxID=980011 RepID=UPI00404B8E19
MPKYAIFLKDILSNKEKLAEVSSIPLSVGCSAVLQSKLPKKMADPGSFTIPCILGDDTVRHALANLGASINLMPYSVFSKLGLGEPRPTRMSIQLADRSVKYTRGVVENMLVRIDKLIFPVDFVILDMNEDDSSLKHPKLADESLYFVDTIVSHVREFFTDICGEPTLDPHILNREISEVEMVAMTAPPLMDDTVSPPLDSESAVEIVRDDPRDRPSIESPPPSLELKDLPNHLEYAFLDEERKLPVIIASALTEVEKLKLLKVLKAHKEAIAWKIIDIKGINPSLCTHKILMEDNFKSAVQPQWRLNTKMLEIHKLEELRDHAYAHSYNYKLKTKELHDRKFRGDKKFKCGDAVLLFNSRLKLFPGKLKSRWYGPYTVKEVFPYGAIEIEDKNGSFKVNGHRLKHYIGEKASMEEGEVLRLTVYLG